VVKEVFLDDFTYAILFFHGRRGVLTVHNINNNIILIAPALQNTKIREKEMDSIKERTSLSTHSVDV
jgi:hypothetical protein